MRVSFLSVSRRPSRASTAAVAARFQVVGLGDAHAVLALAAEIRKLAGRRREAVHRPGEHLRQRVLAGALGPGKDDGVGEAVARQHAAEAVNDAAIAVELRKSH